MRSLSTSLSGGSFYGREQFKPGEIIAQLVVIQVLLYTADSILLGVLDYMLGVGDFFAGNISKGAPKNIILEQVFNPDIPSLRSSPGIIAVVAFVSATLVFCPIAFVFLVGRSKRALDFSATLCLTHLVCCTIYGGFPSNTTWWLMVAACCAGMTLLCEVLSRRLELREIAVPTHDIENQPQNDAVNGIRPT